MLKYRGIRPKYQNQNGFGDLMLGPVGKSIEFRTRVDLHVILKYYILPSPQKYTPRVEGAR